jgi:hypothetical protein
MPPDSFLWDSEPKHDDTAASTRRASVWDDFSGRKACGDLGGESDCEAMAACGAWPVSAYEIQERLSAYDC